MDLYELTKDVTQAVDNHCERSGRVSIKAVDMRYKQTDYPKEDYFEQDVVVKFTRLVRQGDKEFGFFVDSMCVGMYPTAEEKNEALHLIYHGQAQGDPKCCMHQSQVSKSFLNYHTFCTFSDCMMKYFNEAELTLKGPAMVYVKMSEVRDMLKEKIPVVTEMLPRDLYEFIRRMLDEMDLNGPSDYREGLNKSYFTFFIEDLKERGVINPCFEQAE